MTRSKFTTLQAIQGNCEMEPNTGCWLWLGCLSPDGYGQVIRRHPEKRILPHRLAFILAGGVIPEGFELDHTCRQRSCCNPKHLRAVTQRENIFAPGSLALAVRNAKATHCPQGHPYSGDNLYLLPKGGRDCRECKRLRRREWLAAHREEYNAHARIYMRARRVAHRDEYNARRRELWALKRAAAAEVSVG